MREFVLHDVEPLPVVVRQSPIAEGSGFQEPCIVALRELPQGPRANYRHAPQVVLEGLVANAAPGLGAQIGTET